MFEAPAHNHAEGEHEEERAGLFDGEQGVEVSASQDSYRRQHQDDAEEGGGALHYDVVALLDEARRLEQRIGEQDGADEKRGEAPRPRNAKCRDDEHGKSGCHAQWRNHYFLCRDGGAALANAPDHDSSEAYERTEKFEILLG